MAKIWSFLRLKKSMLFCNDSMDLIKFSAIYGIEERDGGGVERVGRGRGAFRKAGRCEIYHKLFLSFSPSLVPQQERNFLGSSKEVLTFHKIVKRKIPRIA
jgi:hypothetical protein